MQKLRDEEGALERQLKLAYKRRDIDKFKLKLRAVRGSKRTSQG